MIDKRRIGPATTRTTGDRRRGTRMSVSSQAGRQADAAQLVNVEQLIGAYYDLKPDVTVPGQRVAFGTSGHRGSAFQAAFNEPHILATTEAICRYRPQQG